MENNLITIQEELKLRFQVLKSTHEWLKYKFEIVMSESCEIVSQAQKVRDRSKEIRFTLQVKKSKQKLENIYKHS